MTGNITYQSGVLNGVIHSRVSMTASVHNSRSDIVPLYNGEYTVVPKTVSQELLTKDKKMKDNVTIKSIPYFETSNEEGTTVYIGDDLYG